LGGNAIQGIADGGRTVVGGGDEGDFHNLMV
jgi:hypothetical protein